VLPAFSFVTPGKCKSIAVEQIAKGYDRDVTEHAAEIGRLTSVETG
jgi:hypothetical protein